MEKDTSLELALPSDAKFCIDIKSGEDGLRAYVTVLDCYGNQIPYRIWTNAKNFAFDWDDPKDFIYVTMPDVATVSRLMNLAFRWSIADSLIFSEDEDQDDNDDDDEE